MTELFAAFIDAITIVSFLTVGFLWLIVLGG